MVEQQYCAICGNSTFYIYTNYVLMESRSIEKVCTKCGAHNKIKIKKAV